MLQRVIQTRNEDVDGREELRRWKNIDAVGMASITTRIWFLCFVDCQYHNKQIAFSVRSDLGSLWQVIYPLKLVTNMLRSFHKIVSINCVVPYSGSCPVRHWKPVEPTWYCLVDWKCMLYWMKFLQENLLRGQAEWYWYRHVGQQQLCRPASKVVALCNKLYRHIFNIIYTSRTY